MPLWISAEDDPAWEGKKWRPGRNGEHVCIHGVGHGQADHACDGCCSRGDYPRKPVVG